MKRTKWKENKLLTILMIILTPIISFCLMEGITGNLLTLSKAGFILDVMISCGILLIQMLIFAGINFADHAESQPISVQEISANSFPEYGSGLSAGGRISVAGKRIG